MKALTISTHLLKPQGDKPLTPAMVTALWVIADHIDRKKIQTTADDAVWLEIPSTELRGSEGRTDNYWLRECLNRLKGMSLEGEYRGDPWSAVIVAEWRITQGGAIVRLLLPPSALIALKVRETFSKIEAFAAYKLDAHARRLYAALADKKRLSQSHWDFSLAELRTIFGVEDKKSYARWNNFRQWVLAPAVEQVNDFGTVNVKMVPQRVGRSIDHVRFIWHWKTIDEARETDEENEKADIARRQPDTPREAPPLTEAAEPPRRKDGTEEERGAFVDNLLKANGWG